MATPLYLLVALAFAQDQLSDSDPIATAEAPKGVAYVTQEQAQATFKMYVDDFPGFPTPIALSKRAAKHYEFSDFKKAFYDYHEKFMWYPDIGEGFEDYLSTTMMQSALTKNASGERGGYDPDKAGRWICGLAVAARGYFHFYSYTSHPEEAEQLHGGQYATVNFTTQVLNKFSDRFKEVTTVDLKEALNYPGFEGCLSKAADKLTKELPPAAVKPQSKPTDGDNPPGTFTGRKSGLGYYVNTGKGYYESWRWSDAGLALFLDCKAHITAGGLIYETTIAQTTRRPIPEGVVGHEVRDPRQPPIGTWIVVDEKKQKKICAPWKAHPDHKKIYGF
jgi:hypothetical protein